jgi:hypothetical protein
LAVLMGGNPTYGNVQKLPNALWRHYGIAIVEHRVKPGSRPGARGDGHLGLAIVLVDQTSHNLSEAARGTLDEGGKIVYCPSTWTHLRQRLEAAGIRPYPSTRLCKPEAEKPKPVLVETAAPEPKPEEPFDDLPDEPDSISSLLDDLYPPNNNRSEPEEDSAMGTTPPISPTRTITALPTPSQPQPTAQPTILDLIPGELRERLQGVQELLNTPAVRAVTGKAITPQATVEIALRRGLDTLETELLGEEK